MGTPDTSVDNTPPGQSSLDLGPVLVGQPSDEFYTPRWLFDVLDLTFALDVAAPVGGAPWVPADRYYTPRAAIARVGRVR